MTRANLFSVDPKLDLVLERYVDVPCERVWAAWTQPEHIKKWFTPAPWQTVECEIDLRPGGLFRTEERAVPAPALARARAQGIDARGPYAPDTVFMRARSTAGRAGEFDVVVAMYHDQGLIPVKYLGVDKGVNVTLGLPLVRTSPDHGTAFDIAGQGVADASSLIEAVRMARRLAR